MSEQKQLNVADSNDDDDEVSFFLHHAKWLALSEDDGRSCRFFAT